MEVMKEGDSRVRPRAGSVMTQATASFLTKI